MHDLMDFFQEVFECDNRAVSDVLSNALLFYCYLPVVLGSIASENKPIISINTAQFILIQTFSHIKYQPFVNTLVASLLLSKVPYQVKNAITVYPEKDPGTYSFKWNIKLGIHYSVS